MGVCVGCAHTDKTEVTLPEPDPSAELRRENASLRRRVQMLEDRVLRLEHAGPADADESADIPTSLPVVKLQPPPAPAPAPAPATPAKLDAPHPAPAQREMMEDPAGLADVGPVAVVKSEKTRSYRLVGNRLVELTKKNAPAGPDKPQKGKRGNRIVAEYDAAMALLKAGEATGAELAFGAFAQQHPRHAYADNALYWKGEAAYDQKHYSDALAAFTEVVERYGGGNKAPDALLKIGLCYRNLGDKDNARDVLSELIAAYPGASASDIARLKLAEFEI